MKEGGGSGGGVRSNIVKQFERIERDEKKERVREQ
jgi:hypothetical protein